MTSYYLLLKTLNQLRYCYPTTRKRTKRRKRTKLLYNYATIPYDDVRLVYQQVYEHKHRYVDVHLQAGVDVMMTMTMTMTTVVVVVVVGDQVCTSMDLSVVHHEHVYNGGGDDDDDDERVPFWVLCVGASLAY
jgi:hypothetical protein